MAQCLVSQPKKYVSGWTDHRPLSGLSGSIFKEDFYAR